jgi:hypothetical protein
VISGADFTAQVIEFNYRAWNGPESGYNMAWHPDDCSGGRAHYRHHARS